jgi:hypothetical protein
MAAQGPRHNRQHGEFLASIDYVIPPKRWELTYALRSGVVHEALREAVRFGAPALRVQLIRSHSGDAVKQLYRFVRPIMLTARSLHA